MRYDSTLSCLSPGTGPICLKQLFGKLALITTGARVVESGFFPINAITSELQALNTQLNNQINSEIQKLRDEFCACFQAKMIKLMD